MWTVTQLQKCCSSASQSHIFQLQSVLMVSRFVTIAIK